MKKTIKAVALFLMLLGAGACTDLTKLNQDPTKSTDINPNLLIPNIQFTQTYGYNNCMRYLIYPGGFCNHFTGAWAMVEYAGKGKKNTGYMERLWTIYYPEIVWNLVALENLTADKPEYANQNAMAKLLRVEVFTKLTDYYGDIPYFEAGQGYAQGKLNPRYDKQEDIYMDFFRLIDEALAQLDETGATVTNDLFYAGDITRWKKFANSLKLRTAMRLIKVKPELAKEKAKEAYEGGLMESNDDTAYVTFQNDSQDEGPGNGYANAFTSLYNANYGPTQIRITSEFLQALIVRGEDRTEGGSVFRTIRQEDPRLRFIAGSYTANYMKDAFDITEICRQYNSTTASQQGPADLGSAVDGYLNIGGYLTVPAQEFNYGGGIQKEHGVNAQRSVWAGAIKKNNCPDLPVKEVTHHLQRLQPSKYIQAANSPWVHLSYAETLFLLAETTLRGWDIDSETAEERFAKGVKAAIGQWSIFVPSDIMPSDATTDSYIDLLRPNVQAGGTTALEAVARQLWIIFALDPIEAWSLIRRTDGMPSEYVQFYNRYPTENETGGKRPCRMQYPMEEQTKNKASYDEAVARMGGTDDWMSPIWWDVQ